MNFKSPSKILDTLRASDQVEKVRGDNRVKVLDLFNGVPPLSDDAASKMGLRINTNWGEGPVIAAHGRRQYDNAVLGTQNFFTVTIPLAPGRKKKKWEMFITDFINRVMKLSESYACLKEYQTASILLSGIGPQIWRDKEAWEPDYVAVEDLRVATNTKTSFKDLGWFAELHYYTPGELSKKVFGKHSDQAWKKPAIQKILDAYQEQNYENTEYNWFTSPEKMADLHRQNAGFYSSDAVPTIPLWHFYYENDESPAKSDWSLCVVPDHRDGAVKGAPQNEFLYQSDKPVAAKLSQLLHCQFGDLNSKSPFMYHAVRSMGFLLMEPCFWTNLTRCRELQHLHETMNILFKVTDPAGKERAKKIQMFDRGILEEGVTIVPQAERHQIDPRLLETVMAQLKQLQSEASSTYTQDIDTGTQKEQTAFETHAKLSSVNAMMGALLTRYFRKEAYAYREICRRFCLRNSSDPDVRRFQKAAKELGIPALFLNVDYWDVTPEVPMGAGNPTMAMAQAQQIMSVRTMLDPSAQQEALHEFIETTTGDWRKAERWVPIESNRGISDGTRDAQLAFGTLMQGVPVPLKEGYSPIDQIETLLPMMAGVISRVEGSTNLSTAAELVGLQTVQGYIGRLIQALAQNKQEQQRVKQYSDSLGKLGNSLKGFAQRLQALQEQGGKETLSLNYKDAPASIQRQMEAKAGFKPATENSAQVSPKMEQAVHAVAVKEASARQKAMHTEQAFAGEQKRKDAGAFADIQREKIKTDADLVNQKKVADAQAAATAAAAAAKPKPKSS